MYRRRNTMSRDFIPTGAPRRSGMVLWFLFAGLQALAAGWRFDGTGAYPEATPPLTWDEEHNIAWKVTLPGWSNATPVPAGGRLFMALEPDSLLCVSAADGAVLWSRSITYLDLVPEEEKEDAAARQAEGERLARELRDVQRTRSRVQRQLRENPDDEELKQEVSTREAEIAALRREMEPYLDLVVPATHRVAGFTSPTPVSDGNRVFVLFGTGIAACFDLDGNRIWARFIERPTHEWGHSASPVLAGGTLVTHIRNITGLDPDTGAIRWQIPSQARFGAPVGIRMGDREAVLTAHGDMVDAGNGAVIAEGLGTLEYCAPLWHDGVAYFIEHGGRAVRVSGDGGEPEVLWTTEPPKDRYYASPVYAEGLLYAITRNRVLSVIEAETGEVVYSHNLRLGGTAYPSPAYAGGHIFVSSDSGSTLVIEPGREFKPVATNRIESFRASPLFLGDRIYLRTLNHLYCIAAPGP